MLLFAWFIVALGCILFVIVAWAAAESAVERWHDRRRTIAEITRGHDPPEVFE